MPAAFATNSIELRKPTNGQNASSEGATPRNKFEKAEREYLALEAESKKLDMVASGANERISSTQRELDTARKLLEGKSEDMSTPKKGSLPAMCFRPRMVWSLPVEASPVTTSILQ